MHRIAIALVLVLELAAAGCKKSSDGEARTGTGSGSGGGSAAAAAGSGSEPQPTAASGSDTKPAAGSSGLPDCDAWIAAVDKIATCDKMKDKADAIRQTADIMRKLLPDIVHGGDAKKIERTAAECRTNLEAIKASGCPL
jgi:hypothetical protein